MNNDAPSLASGAQNQMYGKDGGALQFWLSTVTVGGYAGLTLSEAGLNITTGAQTTITNGMTSSLGNSTADMMLEAMVGGRQISVIAAGDRWGATEPFVIALTENGNDTYTVNITALRVRYANPNNNPVWRGPYIISTPAAATFSDIGGTLRLTAGNVKLVDLSSNIAYTYSVDADPAYLSVAQDDGNNGSTDATGRVHQDYIMQRLVID